MLSAAPIVAYLLLTAAAPIAPGSHLAVLPTVLDEAAKAAIPETVDEIVVDALLRSGDFKVTSQSDIMAVLDFEQQRQLLGCDDTFCMSELAGALGAPFLLAVSISQLDTAWLISAKIIQARSSEVLARTNKLVRGDGQTALRAIPQAVASLFGVSLDELGVLVELSPAAQSMVNIHLDVAAALFYGPHLVVEIGTHWSVLLRARFLNLGLATLMGANKPERGERFQFGIGTGVGGRWYFGRPGNMRGAYAGMAAEYWYARVDDKHFDRESYITHAIIGQAEAGYRFTVDRLFFTLGAHAGYYTPLSTRTIDLSDGDDLMLYPPAAKAAPTMGIAGDIGFYF